MADSGNGLNDNAAVALTGKIMVIAIILLFLVVLFVLFLHLYARWFWWRVEEPAVNANGQGRGRRRRRFVFVPGQGPAAAAARRGLEPSVLRSLPVVIFRPEEFEEGLECAVCLSDLAEGEKARMLPKCNHGFHVDCIDMWFKSHTTCPLCRDPVAGPEAEVDCPPDNADTAGSIRLSTSSSFRSMEESFEPQSLPTNVLFWGDETHVNSCLEEGTPSSSSSSSGSGLASEGMLVIDIPRHGIEDQTTPVSPSTSGHANEELKSPAPTRLMSLKRLLSRDRKINPATSEDVEQV